jgi:hypothetical protein
MEFVKRTLWSKTRPCTVAGDDVVAGAVYDTARATRVPAAGRVPSIREEFGSTAVSPARLKRQKANKSLDSRRLRLVRRVGRISE